ncbi:MAG: hypothetical protein ABW123_13655 [Cystobacter sp.]
MEDARHRRIAVIGWSLLLGTVMLGQGCHCAPTPHDLTTWFKYEEKEPLLELPHMLRIGQRSSRSFTRIGETWYELPEQEGPALRSSRNGQAVFGNHRIYLEGRKAPIETGDAPCLVLEGGWKEGRVACLGLLSQGRCDRIAFTEFSLDGEGARRDFRVDVPEAAFGCPWSSGAWSLERLSVLGYDAQGSPFIAAQSANPHAPSVRSLWVLRVGKEGATFMAETPGEGIAADQAEIIQHHLLTPPRWPGREDVNPDSH